MAEGVPDGAECATEQVAYTVAFAGIGGVGEWAFVAECLAHQLYANQVSSPLRAG